MTNVMGLNPATPQPFDINERSGVVAFRVPPPVERAFTEIITEQRQRLQRINILQVASDAFVFNLANSDPILIIAGVSAGLSAIVTAESPPDTPAMIGIGSLFARLNTNAARDAIRTGARLLAKTVKNLKQWCEEMCGKLKFWIQHAAAVVVTRM